MLKINPRILQNEICRRDLSVTAFAEKSGTDSTLIYNILHGGKSRISTVGKIAAALGMDFTELIESEPPSELVSEIIRRGLTLKGFAKKAGIGEATLFAILKGRRQCRTSTEMKILSALCLK